MAVQVPVPSPHAQAGGKLQKKPLSQVAPISPPHVSPVVAHAPA